MADAGGFRASLGIALAVGLGWAVLGAAIGISGGVMIRSSDRALYGVAGGSVGGFLGGLLFTTLSATSIWSALAGLALLGLSIGAFINLVEEAFISAKLKVIKGRHLGREFPLLKELNVWAGTIAPMFVSRVRKVWVFSMPDRSVRTDATPSKPTRRAGSYT
jgi:hypothetical protein